MKFNLISSEIFLDQYIRQKKFNYEKYLEYEDTNANKPDILAHMEQFNINLKPYLYILDSLKDYELKTFTIYFISYLVRSGMITEYKYINIYDLLMLDVEYILACIICMQYYF